MSNGDHTAKGDGTPAAAKGYAGYKGQVMPTSAGVKEADTSADPEGTVDEQRRSCKQR